MPGGLAELVSLGVDPAGMPLRGIAYLDHQRRVEAPFRRLPWTRRARRTTLHAALASRAKEQDTEWISTRVTSVDQDYRRRHGSRGPSEMADCRRRAAFGGPPRRRYQRRGRTPTTVRGSLALPSAGVVRVRRSALVTVGRSVCDTRRARPCRRGSSCRKSARTLPGSPGWHTICKAQTAGEHAAADPCDRWCPAVSRDGCCWWEMRLVTRTRAHR